MLEKYGVRAEDRLGQGMEAEVYSYGKDRVLKVYPGTMRVADLRALQDFYASLKVDGLSYELPRIEAVFEEGEFVVTIEKRLFGSNMDAILPRLSESEQDRVMELYLDAALELRRLSLTPPPDRYKLFDAQDISRRSEGDWHHFLRRFLASKRVEVGPYLERDVDDFPALWRGLEAVLSPPYTGGYSVIHGDFFPGNLLVDEQYRVTALLDFGLMTLYGDPMFDLATGWVFFDMYDLLRANLRERLLHIMLDRLGQAARDSLYRYVLIYSILSANTYSKTCEDGHYAWCVQNLNASVLRQVIA